MDDINDMVKKLRVSSLNKIKERQLEIPGKTDNKNYTKKSRYKYETS